MQIAIRKLQIMLKVFYLHKEYNYFSLIYEIVKTTCSRSITEQVPFHFIVVNCEYSFVL